MRPRRKSSQDSTNMCTRTVGISREPRRGCHPAHARSAGGVPVCADRPAPLHAPSWGHGPPRELRCYVVPRGEQACRARACAPVCPPFGCDCSLTRPPPPPLSLPPQPAPWVSALQHSRHLCLEPPAVPLKIGHPPTPAHATAKTRETIPPAPAGPPLPPPYPPPPSSPPAHLSPRFDVAPAAAAPAVRAAAAAAAAATAAAATDAATCRSCGCCCRRTPVSV